MGLRQARVGACSLEVAAVEDIRAAFEVGRLAGLVAGSCGIIQGATSGIIRMNKQTHPRTHARRHHKHTAYCPFAYFIVAYEVKNTEISQDKTTNGIFLCNRTMNTPRLRRRGIRRCWLRGRCWLMNWRLGFAEQSSEATEYFTHTFCNGLAKLLKQPNTARIGSTQTSKGSFCQHVSLRQLATRAVVGLLLLISNNASTGRQQEPHSETGASDGV